MRERAVAGAAHLGIGKAARKRYLDLIGMIGASYPKAGKIEVYNNALMCLSRIKTNLEDLLKSEVWEDKCPAENPLALKKRARRGCVQKVRKEHPNEADSGRCLELLLHPLGSLTQVPPKFELAETLRYPPAIAATMRNGCAPLTTASGSGVSGASSERSRWHAKKRKNGRRRWVA